VLCASSLFATDRILLYSTFMDHLTKFAEPIVLSDAVSEPTFPRDHRYGRFFRPVSISQSFPHELTLLRHFETYLWDYTKISASRESFWALRKSNETSRRELALNTIAKALSPLRLENWAERQLEKLLVRYGVTEQTLAWFEKEQPDLLVAMYPFTEPHMVMAAAAKRFGIPTLAFITSWDNITTKGRLVYQYDGYVVWSEQMKEELYEYYPQSRNRLVVVAGSPQYDVFFEPKYRISREDFLGGYGLDPNKQVILYSLGSPHMIREDYGAVEFVERMFHHPELSKAQIIIRPHPAKNEVTLTALEHVRRKYPQIVIQTPHRSWQKLPFQTEESTIEWVNTVRHANVVINLSSTMAVDAAIFDRPVVNLDFDPEPGTPNRQLVQDANHKWDHFKPIAESGGLWMVNNIDEMVTATATYLRQPELHREKRRWIVERVCGKVDGKAGRKMAEAVKTLLDQSQRHR
jgi:hypothetical protein